MITLKIKTNVMKLIEEQAKEFISQQESTACTGNQSTTPESPPAKKRKLCTFLKRVEKESSDLSPEMRVVKEIEAYLGSGSPNLDIESDTTPLKWWKKEEKLYPTLAKLVMKIFCVCVTRKDYIVRLDTSHQ